jgi:hypothetical protein
MSPEVAIPSRHHQGLVQVMTLRPNRGILKGDGSHDRALSVIPIIGPWTRIYIRLYGIKPRWCSALRLRFPASAGAEIEGRAINRRDELSAAGPAAGRRLRTADRDGH